MARKAMHSWIQEVLLDPNKEKCTHIICYHKVMNSIQEVYNQKIGNDGADPKKLAEIFLGKAENHVNDVPNSQLFYLRAYHGSETDYQQFSFRVDGGSDLGAGETEPATKEGALAQTMRHAEANFRVHSVGIGSLVTQQHTLLETTMNQLRLITQENFDSMRVVKEVMLAQIESLHATKMKEIENARNNRIMEKLTSFLPTLANTMTGEEVFPQSTADTALLETIFENVTPEQIKLLGNFLPPEVMGPLADRAAKHLEAKQKVEETAERILTAPKGKTNGKPATPNGAEGILTVEGESAEAG